MARNKKKDALFRYKHKGKNHLNLKKGKKKSGMPPSKLVDSMTTHKSIWTVKKR